MHAKVTSSSAVGSGGKFSDRLALGGIVAKHNVAEGSRFCAFSRTLWRILAQGRSGASACVCKHYQFSSVQLFKDMQARVTTSSAFGKRQQIFEPFGAGRPVSPEIPYPSSPGTTSQRIRNFTRFLEPSGAFWPRVRDFARFFGPQAAGHNVERPVRALTAMWAANGRSAM